MATYTAEQIAKWFIYYNNNFCDEYGGELISNLKLQKLLYYAQGCFLAIKDRPLFDDPIEAWEHGPVVRNIYTQYKSYYSSGIPYEGSFDEIIEKEDEELLEEVYNTFGKYSAWALRNMTHQETPWKETKKNCEISQESIKKYFKENYVD